MKEKILANMHNPEQLEQLFRENKNTFRQHFNSVYQELNHNPLAEFWRLRLNYESEGVSWGTAKGLYFVLLASLLAGLLAKLPEVSGINEAFFYMRNTGFIAFTFITAFFAWKNELQPVKIYVLAGVLLLSVVYINLLPTDMQSDTLLLACLHLPVLLWMMLGFAFVGNSSQN
ncbi:MAG: hypothetical protein LPK19_06790, partial [Hymenobacteraceae bacterium]|nr:hypothetical protein [Hymenobacteraceae bacterium]MDX5395909.1 hypothetical protein [Hymenobacteraceae bacterium]MDX5511966.1 hypothetical protein [Hymenobacteraceae bacterium]